MKWFDRELELSTRVLLAAEDWAPTYQEAPKQHAELIKNAARMDRQVMTYFRDLAKEMPNFIDWYAYSRAVIEQSHSLQAAGIGITSIQAYDVKVVVNQNALDLQDQAFIKIVFDTIASTVVAGIESMEVTAGTPIGLTTTSAIVQELTTNQLANLVGMKVDKASGLITPNPNAAISIDETTRNQIAQSIKTSIQLGENQKEAAARLEDVIANPTRADLIARNETVRAYAQGRKEYAHQSGHTGKYNVDSNAIDICADNTAEGVIGIDEDFVSGDPEEPFHVNCKCQVKYTYDDTTV